MWQNTKINSIPTCTRSLLSSLELRLYFTCQSSKIMPKFKNTFFSPLPTFAHATLRSQLPFYPSTEQMRTPYGFHLLFFNLPFNIAFKGEFWNSECFEVNMFHKTVHLKGLEKMYWWLYCRNLEEYFFDIFRRMFSTLHSLGLLNRDCKCGLQRSA